MRKIVVLPDVHLDLKPSKAYTAVKRFIARFVPDEIILLGDFGNFTSVSHWIENRRGALENRRYALEIQVIKRELTYLKTCCSKLVYIIGNHENWVDLYLSKHPEFKGILELNKMIDFKKIGVDVIPFNRLYRVGKKAKLYFTHGMYAGKYHANAHLTRLGCNIVYGHLHSPQVALLNMRMIEPYMAWGLGWLGDEQEMMYLQNKPVNWIHQFAVVEMEDTIFSVTPVNIINNQFIYNGKLFKL